VFAAGFHSSGAEGFVCAAHDFASTIWSVRAEIKRDRTLPAPLLK
jgi:hypothetical protein